MQINYLPPNEFFQLLEHWRYALIARLSMVFLV